MIFSGFVNLNCSLISDLKSLPDEHGPGPLTVLLHVGYLTNTVTQMISWFNPWQGFTSKLYWLGVSNKAKVLIWGDSNPASNPVNISTP